MTESIACDLWQFPNTEVIHLDGLDAAFVCCLPEEKAYITRNSFGVVQEAFFHQITVDVEAKYLSKSLYTDAVQESFGRRGREVFPFPMKEGREA